MADSADDGSQPDDFTTENLVVKSYYVIPVPPAAKDWVGSPSASDADDTGAEDDAKWLAALDTAVERGCIGVYDAGGAMGRIMGQHVAQLVYWDKDTSCLVREFRQIGYAIPEMPVPVPTEDMRDTGFLCAACGQDRGMDARCPACGAASKRLHVVDGRIVE